MAEAKEELLLQITDLIQQARPNGPLAESPAYAVACLILEVVDAVRPEQTRNEQT